nr:WXG100 family type VII secretion target [Nocardioides flavescens]
MEHQALRKAVSDVQHAREQLQQARANADNTMSGFLGTGWTGSAATAFSEAWEEWRAGATQVEGGLEAMAALLDAVHRDMTEQDAASQASLDQVSARIVDRLG